MILFSGGKTWLSHNQDKIIVVVTHAPLEGSNIPLSTQNNRQISGSERFRDVLKKYSVDLWLSGHLHLPHEFNNTLNKNSELNGTVFVHISSIRPEFLGLKHSQSRVLDFYCNKDKVLIKSRDHDVKNWNEEIEEKITLSKKIICNP